MLIKVLKTSLSDIHFFAYLECLINQNNSSFQQ